MEPLRSVQSHDAMVVRALELRADVDRFNRRWPPMAGGEQTLNLGWEEFERQLVDLAPTDLQAELVHRLVARTRAFAAFKPSEMVLRELLCIAALVLDPSQSEADQPDSTGAQM